MRRAVDECFRVPLHGEEIGAVVALDALDETIGRDRGGQEMTPELPDALVRAIRAVAEFKDFSSARRKVTVPKYSSL